MSRPDYVEDEHLEFLDELRESGVTNMFAAGPALMTKFEVNKYYARDILHYWMDTFGQENR